MRFGRNLEPIRGRETDVFLPRSHRAVAAWKKNTSSAPVTSAAERLEFGVGNKRRLSIDTWKKNTSNAPLTSAAALEIGVGKRRLFA